MLENIIPNQTLEMENVLFFREILLEEVVVSISNGLENIIRDTGAEKAGPTVTATHDIDVEKGEIDLEIKIPLSKKIESSGRYEVLPEFKVENALKMRVIGETHDTDACMQALQLYIKENSLIPTTPLYTATVQEAKKPGQLRDMIIDLYI